MSISSANSEKGGPAAARLAGGRSADAEFLRVLDGTGNRRGVHGQFTGHEVFAWHIKGRLDAVLSRRQIAYLGIVPFAAQHNGIQIA